MNEIRSFYIENPTSGALRFTAKGLEFFRERFAKIGVDIRHIRTMIQFRDVYQKWWNSEFAVAAINNKVPAIDNLFSDFSPYKEGVRLRDKTP